MAARFAAHDSVFKKSLRKFEIGVAGPSEIKEIGSLVASVKLSVDHIGEADVWLIHKDYSGRVVGCMALERRGSNVYIQSLSVAVGHRREGIGRALIDYGFDNYLGDGDKLIALTMFWNKEIYERLGFRQADSRELKRADDVGARRKHIHCMALIKAKAAQ